MKRRVPDEFAPAITPGHELVDYRVTVREKRPRRGRHVLRLKIEYGSLPNGIWERAVAEGATREDLRKHPDVVWTHPPTWKSPIEPDPAEPIPPIYPESRSDRGRTAIALVNMLDSDNNLDRWLQLLQDPGEYHWEALRGSCIGAATVAAARGARSQEIRQALGHANAFIARAFAAKWLLSDDTNHRLYPTASSITFPSDSRVLRMSLSMLGVMLSRHNRYADIHLPLPAACIGAKALTLFPSEMSYLLGYARGWCGAVLSAIESADHSTPGAIVDEAMERMGNQPMPGSITALPDVVRHMDLSESELMGWVWADRWSAHCLGQDLERLVPSVINRLEGAIGEPSVGKRSRLLIAFDAIKWLRGFVRDALEMAYGEDWKSAGLTQQQNGQIARMWAEDGRRAKDDFESYAEIALLSAVIDKRWGECFQPILESRAEGGRRWKKIEVLSRLSRLIELRNAVAHSKWELKPNDHRELLVLSEDLEQWRERLETYKRQGRRRG